MGADKKRINNIPAGNVVAISGLGNVNPGETIVDISLNQMKPFEEIQYLAAPVVTVAIEPTMLRNLPTLKHVLEKYDLEDPNLIVKIDDQSGEILLMGLGELHLETVVKDISEEVECTASDPIVVYVERISKSSGPITEQLYETDVKLQVEPIQKDNVDIEGDQMTYTEKLRQYNNEIIIEKNVISKISNETQKNILMGVKNALALGPIASKPVSGVRITIIDFNAISGEKFEHTIPLLRNTVWKALKKSGISVQEPFYKIQITSPTNYLGKVTSIINKRRGDILDVRSDQDLLIVSGTLPVAESFNIDQNLRSETEGRAFWQMTFERYEPISVKNIK